MTTPRQSLYRRLPEIYRIRDAELFPVGQLQAYLDVLDEIPAGMRDNIEALYHDLFIETCADWVVPYIADLLGTSHLSGDPWTLRADVARTVFHRRRKGTLGAVESLVFTLSGWAAQAVELRNNLAWTQHLNHQRPDAGGAPPLLQRTSLASAVRGGTLPIRAPAAVELPQRAVRSLRPRRRLQAGRDRGAALQPAQSRHLSVAAGGLHGAGGRSRCRSGAGGRGRRGRRGSGGRALHRSSAGRSDGAVQHPSLPDERRAAEPEPSGRSARADAVAAADVASRIRQPDRLRPRRSVSRRRAGNARVPAARGWCCTCRIRSRRPRRSSWRRPTAGCFAAPTCAPGRRDCRRPCAPTKSRSTPTAAGSCSGSPTWPPRRSRSPTGCSSRTPTASRDPPGRTRWRGIRSPQRQRSTAAAA